MKKVKLEDLANAEADLAGRFKRAVGTAPNHVDDYVGIETSIDEAAINFGLFVLTASKENEKELSVWHRCKKCKSLTQHGGFKTVRNMKRALEHKRDHCKACDDRAKAEAAAPAVPGPGGNSGG